MTKTILFVCVSCKNKNSTLETTMVPGKELYKKLKSQNTSKSLHIVPVKCLAACSNGCSIAISSNNKWSYIYGEMDPKLDTKEILLGANAYGNSADGIVAWRERPAIFRQRTRARMPPTLPMESPNE